MGFKGGKQKHMASAAAEIYANPYCYRLQPNSPMSSYITRASTLLLGMQFYSCFILLLLCFMHTTDDDLSNIRAALQHQVRALWLDPSKPSDRLWLLCFVLMLFFVQNCIIHIVCEEFLCSLIVNGILHIIVYMT